MRYMTHGQLIKRLREIIAERGSQKETASFLDISEPYLSDILACKRAPGKKVLTKLGLEPRTVYVEKVA